MSQIFEICIHLSAPPEDAQAEAIASVEIQCPLLRRQISKENLLVDLLTSQERNDLQWYLEEYWKWPYLEFAERGKKVEALLPQVGRRLYHAIFGSEAMQDIIDALQPHEGIHHQISIVSNVPKTLSMPWELLHDEHGFLALRTPSPIAIVRRLPQHISAPHSACFTAPLRVLLITARPRGTNIIDPRGIARPLLDELQPLIETGVVELEFLRPPTFKALTTRLEDSTRPITILHFDGHGYFSKDAGQGILAFENKGGFLDEIKAETFARALYKSSVSLIVLTACQSAQGAEDNAFSSVASQLMQGGVNAVAAMSSSVLVMSATLYTKAFYRALSDTFSIAAAQEQAQRILRDNSNRHSHRFHPNVEGAPIHLCDWWLPHFYQQHPLQLEHLVDNEVKAKEQLDRSKQRPREREPRQPYHDFTGRAQELHLIERSLSQRKFVVICGFGGIGKTALAHEAADWLIRTNMYDKTCFISFAYGGDLAAFLAALATTLGLNDSSYNPSKAATALSRIKTALQEQRVLIIVDDVESILSHGFKMLDPAECKELWESLSDLASAGLGVILTTRNRDLDDDQPMSYDNVTFLDLQGLHPEDAYMLATQILDGLGIDREQIPYTDLRDLLTNLDHHPLAIQLILPLLRERSLSTIRADIPALLPYCVDEAVTGRNKSLLTSLSYSLQYLDEQQSELISRFALFERGASETSAKFVTELLQTTWYQLRRRLEQTGILTTEVFYEGSEELYLHFHPIFIPYLRYRFRLIRTTLQERYISYYGTLAGTLYEQDRQQPRITRLKAQRELPNFQHTFDLLLDQGEIDAASQIASCIIKFLNNFGRERERELLIHRVNNAIAAQSRGNASMLTFAQWNSAIDQGQREFEQGDIDAAIDRFSRLLKLIETRPQGIPLGKESEQHSFALFWLARCFREAKRPGAEKYWQRSLAILNSLIEQQPANTVYLYQRSVLFTEGGRILLDQGQYDQAKHIFEKELQETVKQQDRSGQAAIHIQLGDIAMAQKNFSEARSRYSAALEISQLLGDVKLEAIAWHQLGWVALERMEWDEAERCYLESLQREKQLDNAAGIAGDCNELASITESMGRYEEAEGWYRRVLDLVERLHPERRALAYVNIADFLGRGINERRISPARLAETRRYAEQALAILERLDSSAEIWRALYLLGALARMEGRTKAAQSYRRRERETYAAFEPNRSAMDHKYGTLIAEVAAVARDHRPAEHTVEPNQLSLRQLDGDEKALITAIHRIRRGERDWHVLCDNLERGQALFILRTLEMLGG